MAKVITFGIQKGGPGKTTTAGITAFMLAEDGYNVLAIDTDSQGNLTELLTQMDIYSFRERTVLEALKDQDARPYIYAIRQNLDILPSNDFMATFPRWLYLKHEGNWNAVLKETIEPVIDTYDYIIIDTPPALSEQTLNALVASDYVVAMYETSKFCFSALERFMETVLHAQEAPDFPDQEGPNPGLVVAGILCSLIDIRRSDAIAYLDLVQEEYGNLVFETVIKRKAVVGRISCFGFWDNPEIEKVLEEYRVFYTELMERIKNSKEG